MFGSEDNNQAGAPQPGQPFDHSLPPVPDNQALPPADSSLAAAPSPIISPTMPPPAPVPSIPPAAGPPQLGPPISYQPITAGAVDSLPALQPALSGDLMGIKKQALQSLTPLVSTLDQDPEEKFKTLMMLIQASDNPGLINQAYDVANKITDEKSRAHALLDIVNEINYFSQNSSEEPKEDGQA